MYVLMGKPEGRRPRGRPRCTWEDNNKISLQQIGWEGIHWIELAKDGEK
jgi:hypothetical protein